MSTANLSRAMGAAVLWANASPSAETRLRRLAILSWKMGYDNDRFPTLAKLAASLGMSRQAAHQAVDDMQAFCLARVADPVDARDKVEGTHRNQDSDSDYEHLD